MVASGKTVEDGRSLWYEVLKSRVLKGRKDSLHTFSVRSMNIPDTRRITSGYHLSAALRQIRIALNLQAFSSSQKLLEILRRFLKLKTLIPVKAMGEFPY